MEQRADADALGARAALIQPAAEGGDDGDGSAMIGWTDGSLSYNFLTVPGGGAVAGSYTASGTTTTWVPLIDASGSTIGLVNAANVDAGPVTTYTYDPSGTASTTGSANDWPFQYNGMEKEFTDPSTYYYAGSGQFYSPQLSRSLSEVGETSSSQGACPSGNAIGEPSGSSGFGINFPSNVEVEPENSSEGSTGRTAITVTGAAAVGFTIGAIIGAAVGAPLAGGVIGAAVGAIIGGIASVFEDLFGGGSPPIPRQLRHQRHPLYPAILGLPAGLIPDEMSAGAPQIVGDPSPKNAPPNSKSTPAPSSDCEQNVNNAETLCMMGQAFLGPLLYAGCPLGARACCVAPAVYTCGMAVGLCGSAAALNYLCYRSITEAKAACK
jgi:hypothetical protein